MRINEKFSQNIKCLRTEKLMMSQAEFAELIGVSFESVNRYENCKSSPTYKVKRKLVELMNKYGIEAETNE